jgi:hypothetical protein
MAALWRARNCTIKGVGVGLPLAVSTLRAICIPRRCCRATRCLLREDLITTLVLPRARNCTTREVGAGLPRAISTLAVTGTRRHCYPTGRRSLQGDLTPPSMFSRAQNCTRLLLRQLQPQRLHLHPPRLLQLHRHQRQPPLRDLHPHRGLVRRHRLAQHRPGLKPLISQ